MGVRGVEEAEVSAPTLSLRDFLAILSRRKTTALAVFALVTSAVVLLTLFTPATYRSQARLMLESQSKNSESDALSQIFNSGSGADVENQIQLISSPLILDQVYKEAGLAPDSVTLSAERVTGSDAIDLTALSHSKGDVEKFIDALPQVYRDNRRGARLREVTAQLSFANRDRDAETKKLQQFESAWTQFKNSRGIVDVDSEASAALETLAQSKSDLGSARANTSKLQAQIAALNADLQGLPAFVNTPTTTTNPQLEILRNDLATLKSKRAQLSFLYKDSDDQMRQNALEIKNLEARIARTPPTITNVERAPNPAVVETRDRVAGLGADLQAQQAATKVLQAQIAEQERGLSNFSQIQRAGAQLQRQLEATREAVKSGQATVRDLTVRSKALEAVGAPVTLLARGGPGEKISPKLSRNLIVGLFLGALLACAAALVQDSLDDGVRDEEEARQMLGVPALGYFPLVPVTSENQVLDLSNPDRMLLETFRALRSNVHFALVNSKGKKLQVTSSVPNEGKSYIVSNLALTMALDGRRVILVDADLHRPTLHERLDGKRQPGLSNVLAGEVALQDALQDGAIEGLRFLSAGALPPNSAELLNSPAMEALLAELEKMADLVIVDTPPLLATADAQLLSAKMDGVIFVMQVGSVARSGTLRALELLQQAHANLLGVVFNKVKTGKGASYEYYNGYYSLPHSPDDAPPLETNPTRSLARPDTAPTPTTQSVSVGTVDAQPNGAPRNGNARREL